jgi:hypothetical protein
MTYAQPERVAEAERREKTEGRKEMKNIDAYLYEFLRSPECKALVEARCEFNPPVTLTYALERLTIVHVKLWHLEDQVRNPDLSDAQIGELKRRIDYLNGQIRPRLVQSLGEIIVRAVQSNDVGLVAEPNFKDYKARE